ncbi:MAG: YfbR-like 5'-deoxynucleotidase [Hyphomicrobium sp.]
MTQDSEHKPRAWQRMLSGRRLDLLAPNPADIEIDDIAHGLARVARWNGQTTGAHSFSVAQHSLVVEAIVQANNPGFGSKELLAALLHDAPEYVIGDLISPFKAAIGLDYKAFENRLLAAIHRRYALPIAENSELTTRIKHADRVAAYYEATVLAGFAIEEAQTFFGRPEIPKALHHELLLLEPLPANQAETAFIDRFNQLWSDS